MKEDKSGKTVILSIRFSSEQAKTLRKWADNQPVPPTTPEIVRIAVLEWMKRTIVGMRP